MANKNVDEFKAYLFDLVAKGNSVFTALGQFCNENPDNENLAEYLSLYSGSVESVNAMMASSEAFFTLIDNVCEYYKVVSSLFSSDVVDESEKKLENAQSDIGDVANLGAEDVGLPLQEADASSDTSEVVQLPLPEEVDASSDTSEVVQLPLPEEVDASSDTSEEVHLPLPEEVDTSSDTSEVVQLPLPEADASSDTPEVVQLPLPEDDAPSDTVEDVQLPLPEDDAVSADVVDMPSLSDEVPEISSLDSDVPASLGNDNELEKVDFVVVAPNFIKCILVTLKQIEKLKASRAAQSVIFSSVERNSGNTLESDLVNAGLLPSDDLPIEKKIDILMEQANEAYQAGEKEKAQKLYEVVSKLNQQREVSLAVK